jgi:transcriptional regulator of acetoin/glycerol metabolism
MVEQNGRQIMAAVQAASWPTRQMALAVPSWQQLTASSAAVAAAAADNILQPLFAAAAEADWRHPLIVDSSGGLCLQEQSVFSVYDRATVAATSAAAAAAASSREAAVLAQQQQHQRTGYSMSGASKRSSKPSPLTLHNVNIKAGPSGSNVHPPPAHSSNQAYASSSEYVKKEPSQLSPVKKRIKEAKEQYSNYSSVSQSPAEHPCGSYYNSASRSNIGSAIVINGDTPPLYALSQRPSAPEVITILDSDDENQGAEHPIKCQCL